MYENRGNCSTGMMTTLSFSQLPAQPKGVEEYAMGGRRIKKAE
jgi:hypothetical protein